MSEWGAGWQTQLAITRFRVIGDVAYTASDQLSGPFGRLVKGADGGVIRWLRVNSIGAMARYLAGRETA